MFFVAVALAAAVPALALSPGCTVASVQGYWLSFNGAQIQDGNQCKSLCVLTWPAPALASTSQAPHPQPTHSLTPFVFVPCSMSGAGTNRLGVPL